MNFVNSHDPTRRASAASRWAIATLVTFLAFGIYIASPVKFAADSVWAIHTSMSLLRGNGGDLSEYQKLVDERQLYAARIYHGHPYNLFPIGTSLLAMPAVIAAETYYPKLNDDLKWAVPTNMQKYIASAIGAIAAGLFFCFCRPTSKGWPSP